MRYSGQPHIIMNNRKVAKADTIDEAQSIEKNFRASGAEYVDIDSIGDKYEVRAVFNPFKSNMACYLVEAKGYFGRRFEYIVFADNKAEATQEGMRMLEAEPEWQAGNISKDNYGGLHIVKKVQR